MGKISLISKKYLEVTYIADSAEFLSHPQSVPENPWLQIHFPQVKFPLKLQFSLFGSNSHGHEHKLSTFIVRFCKKKLLGIISFLDNAPNYLVGALSKRDIKSIPFISFG